MTTPNFKPWRFVGQGILIDDDENEIVLGNIYSDDPIGWLISAAPEMYKALRGAMAWEAQTRARLGLPQIDSPKWAQMASAALAKAEGR